MSVLKPNLLYIHSDQHNPYVTGCYGDKVVKTPHLDGLAARGVVLDNVYCPSPICVPSRMSMLSGRFPYENEVWTNGHSLDSSIPTFAHAMGAGGFQPVLIGRMHSVGPDQLHGYAERLVGDHGPNFLGGEGVDHGMLSGTAGPARVSLSKSGIGQSAYQVHDEDVTVAAVDFLNRVGAKKRVDPETDPFCLSVGFMLPHQPFVARREDYERYRGKVLPPKITEAYSDGLHPHIRMWREKCGIQSVTAEEVMRARTAYWALVDRMDHMIGQILSSLRENDLAENTLIVYMSDHGEQVGEHGLWWKQTFYENSAKVPAIVSWPAVLPEGIRLKEVISSLDLNATMIDALGCSPLPHSRGRSLLPLMRGKTSSWENVAFSEFCQDADGAGGPFPKQGVYQRMVRRDAWKLNYYHGQPCQLFNVEEDPDELEDRVNHRDCGDMVHALTQEVLADWEPEEIVKTMAAKREDNRVLSSWAKQTRPKDLVRWTLRPEMDFLE
jgi:choline-sulfatase